jgi:hypothetical protein
VETIVPDVENTTIHPDVGIRPVEKRLFVTKVTEFAERWSGIFRLLQTFVHGFSIYEQRQVFMTGKI